MPPRKLWLNKADAAALLEITITYLDRFWRPLLPEGAEKKDGRSVLIDGHALLKAYAKHGAGSNENSQNGVADLEREKLQVDIATRKLRLQRLEGSLVDREAAKAAVTQLFYDVKSRLEQLPDDLSGSLPPDIRADVVSDMRNQIALALRKLADAESETAAT